MAAKKNSDTTPLGEVFTGGEDQSAPQAADSPYLDEMMANYHPAFILKQKGDYIVGVFTGSLDMASTAYGVCPVITLTLVEGRGLVDSPIGNKAGETYSFWLMGTALVTKFKQERPMAGETIAVVHRGKRKNRAGTFSYNDFGMTVVSREKKAVTWDDLPGDDPESETVTPVEYGKKSEPEF